MNSSFGTHSLVFPAWLDPSKVLASISHTRILLLKASYQATIRAQTLQRLDREFNDTSLPSSFPRHMAMAALALHQQVPLHAMGKFAFVEFRNPDMATAALALHQQVQLMGCNLAVARPSGYMDPVKASK
eukprot:scaffold215073_cov21-Tisochrysis_lutea.AAC.1